MNARALMAYGSLRAPLALLELPLFVLLPALYSATLGVPLALVGAVLFFARTADAIFDPLIGRAMARRRAGLHYRRWIVAGLPPLAIGFGLLLLPPRGLSADAALPVWLALASLVAYLSYSVVTIAYQSWGAELGADAHERARVTATRESFGLAGVIAAALLLDPDHAGWLVAIFVAAGLASGALLGRVGDGAPAASQPESAPVFAPLRDRRFVWLLAAFVVNGIASAIPATLVLLFVRDVLRAESLAGPFLLVYFAAAALGMPLWVRLSGAIGLRGAWLVGMAAAALAFVWATQLGAGDRIAFFIVCAATGVTLGADLSMPAALLAGITARPADAAGSPASYFGFWNLATKLNLAAAAGLALPLLAWLGYSPQHVGATFALTVVYAGLPCLLKLIAAALLWCAPIGEPGIDR